MAITALKVQEMLSDSAEALTLARKIVRRKNTLHKMLTDQPAPRLESMMRQLTEMIDELEEAYKEFDK